MTSLFRVTHFLVRIDMFRRLFLITAAAFTLTGALGSSGCAYSPTARSEVPPINGFSNNLPVPKARVEVYAVHYQTGLRTGGPVHSQKVGEDGRWGPFTGLSGVPYEFVVSAPGYAKTHIYRSPFPRGSDVVHLKADRIADVDLPAFSIIQMVRPRGYLDPTTHHINFDGQSPPPGITVDRVGSLNASKINLAKAQDRAIAAEFHTDVVERVVGRTWLAKENHVVWLEITQ